MWLVGSDENNGKHRKIKRKAPEKCKTSCKLCEYTKFVYVIQVYDDHTLEVHLNLIVNASL